MNAEKQAQERFSRTLSVKDNRENYMQLKDNSTNSKHIAQLKSYLNFRGQAGLKLLTDNVGGGHPDYRINTGVDVGDATHNRRRKDFFKTTSQKIVNVGKNVQKITSLPNVNWEEHIDAHSNNLANFKCTVGSANEVGGNPSMSVTLAYSNSQEGYVVGVHDAGRKAGKAQSGVMFEGAGEYHEAGNPLAGNYSSQHEATGATNLLETSKDGSFDIHSKLTAEAARFSFVRLHIDKISNTTVFGFKDDHDVTYCIPFNVLWKNWDHWFDKKYDLTKWDIINGVERKIREGRPTPGVVISPPTATIPGGTIIL